MQPCRILAADAGGRSPHRASTELVDADGVTGARRQCLENHPISRAEPSRAVHRERTEHRDAHPSKFLRALDSVNRVDTASIPVRSPSGTGRCQNRGARGNRPRTSRSHHEHQAPPLLAHLGLPSLVVAVGHRRRRRPRRHRGDRRAAHGRSRDPGRRRRPWARRRRHRLPRGAPGPTHPCFLVRARWNTALDGPQPVCRAVVASRAVPVARVAPAALGVLRPGLDAMP